MKTTTIKYVCDCCGQPINDDASRFELKRASLCDESLLDVCEHCVQWLSPDPDPKVTPPSRLRHVASFLGIPRDVATILDARNSAGDAQ